VAFPTIPTGSRILGASQANTTAARSTPNLSGLTKNAGDLLIMIAVAYQTTAASGSAWSSWPAGWTEFVDQSGGGTGMAVGAAYKWSDGTETGVLTVTQAATITGHAAVIVMSIPGAHASTPPEATALAQANNAAADPAALDPAGWAAEDTLWIAVAGNGETSTTGSWTGVDAAPTNYSSFFEVSGSDVVGGTGAGVAFRQLNASSENVGTFTHDVSNARTSALTIAVRPTPATAHEANPADTLALADEATAERGAEVAPADTLALADAAAAEVAIAPADSLVLADAVGRDLELVVGDTLGLDDAATPAPGRAVDVADELPFGGAPDSPPTGSRVWYRADSVSPADGTLVWPQDSSGNGRHSVGGSRPAWRSSVVNGKPVYRFNGTSQYVEMPNFMSGVTVGEAIIVKRHVNDPGVNGRMGLWYPYTTGGAFHPYTDGTIREIWGSSQQRDFGDPADPLDEFHIYHVLSKSGLYKAWLNGEELYELTSGHTVSFAASWDLGYSHQGGVFQWLDGDIAEMIWYGRELTTQERADVTAYLAAKYDLFPVGGAGDEVTLETGKAANPADTLALDDAIARELAAAPADTLALADAAARDVARAESDSLGLTDTAALEARAAAADTLGLEDLADPDLTAGGASLEVNPADSLGLADAAARDVAASAGDSLVLADAATRDVRQASADELVLADAVDPDLTGGGEFEVNVGDSLVLADAVAWTATAAPADELVLADAVDRIHAAERAFNDALSLADAVVAGIPGGPAGVIAPIRPGTIAAGPAGTITPSAPGGVASSRPGIIDPDAPGYIDD
jgi:hypothetical protein